MARKKKTKTRKLLDRAFREVHRQTPKAVRRTMQRNPVTAEKQRVAIALNKARKGGARIKKRS